jgi:hypothetical protein
VRWGSSLASCPRRLEHGNAARELGVLRAQVLERLAVVPAPATRDTAWTDPAAPKQHHGGTGERCESR